MLTALLLKQNGIHTQIIDQESRTATHSYSCALHPRTLELLHQVGLAHEAIKLGHRVTSVAFYDGEVRHAEVRLAGLPLEFPFALVLQQSALENLLEQKLHQAEVKIHWGHRLANIDMTGQEVVATIEKLGATGKGYGVPDFESVVEKSLLAKARFVVGADGVNSIVRHGLGVPFERAGDPQHFAVYEIETAGLCGHETRVVLNDNGTSVLWPLSDSRCRWSFQVHPGKMGDDFPAKDRDRLQMVEPSGAHDKLHQLRLFLDHRAPWFRNQIVELVWSADVQFEPRLARQFGQDRCWLAGDAAHQTGPAGMQSMNIGFREAADLARALTQILRHGAAIELLTVYGCAHWSEWQRLLGFKGGSPAVDAASEWVKPRAARIAGCLPASTTDLTALLKQLGIRL